MGKFRCCLGVLCFLFPALTPCHSSTSPGYSVRGEWIELEVDPLTIVLEYSQSEKGRFERNPEGSEEVLYHDPDQGRIVCRFVDISSSEKFRSTKGATTRIFPAYKHSGSKTPVWSFGEVTVRFSDSTKIQSALDGFNSLGFVQLDHSHFDPNVILLRTTNPAVGDGLEMVATLSSMPGVEWAEPNLYGGHTLSMDPDRPNQLHLNVIEIEDAWAINQGNPSVVVAILDEGIDIDHPDLSANIWVNPNESLDGSDNDGNGFVDDFNGWNFINNNNDVRPTGAGPLNAHGTATAGVIAARKDNGIGVVGVAPQCRIIGLRLFDGGGYAGNFNAAEAIRYAARHATVANASWGGGPPSSDIIDAIDQSILNGRGGKGLPIFFASGNSGGPPLDFPSSYAWSVSVGESNTALNKIDLRHEESNFSEALTLIAPLANYTTDISGVGGFDNPNPDYTSEFGGTSSSAPVATGIAALLLSVHPQLTGVETVLKLIETADNPIGGIVHSDRFGKNLENGYGRVNASRAVRTGASSIDDRLEPNNSRNDAPLIRRGSYPWLYLGNDLDYFAVEGVLGGSIQASIQYLSLYGDIGLSIVDENGSTLASGNVTTNQNTYSSTLSFSPPADQRYWIKVFPSGSGQAPYTLTLGSSTADDSSEPNQSIALPTFLNPGPGQTYAGLVCNNDDYFNCALDTGYTLYGLLSFNHSDADLALEIQNSFGSPIQSANAATHGESIDPYTAPGDTEVYLKVSSPLNQSNQEYSLHAAILPSPPVVGGGVDDIYEDNDTVATAAVISEGFYPRLMLDDVGGEVRDLYRISVAPGKSVRITIGWSGPVDVDLQVYDSRVLADPPNTPPIARSRFVSQQIESVHLPAVPSSVDYWVEVIRFAALGRTEYRLAVEFLDPPLPAETAFWRLSEGTLGGNIEPVALRDWRGNLFSNRASAYPGIGTWINGPDPTFFSGSDRLGIDTSGGGLYFSGAGDRGELLLGDQDFTFFARIRPADNNAKRVLGGIPNVWEVYVRTDNTLDATIGTGPGSELFSGTGLPTTPAQWQDVAFVWDRTLGEARFYTSGTSGPYERTALIGSRTISGNGDFHLGSSLGGANGLGGIEQVRYYLAALTFNEFLEIAAEAPPATHASWSLYE